MDKSLPAIQTLFKDSWKLFAKKLLNLFIVNIIGLAGFVFLAIVAAVILLISGVGIGVFSSAFQSGNFNPATFSGMIPLFSIILILLLIGFTVMTIFVVIGSILILDYPDNAKVSFREIFKTSLKFMLPLILIGLLSSLIVLGGVFLFIIPGIVIGFLFSFYYFELILGGKKGLDSIRSSVSLIKSNFWPLALRFFIIWVISILIISVLNDFPVLQFIANILFGWFSLCYIFTAYKQTKATAPNQQAKLLIPVLVSLAGWILIFILGFLGTRYLPQISPKPQQNLEKIYETTQPPSQTQGI
ncbi:hypothetical protein HYW42_01720 [Candidatus Daviesbacteria bacterium]|nr:hypothetical protein [Candidatus Daviesbacteria bacterium]